MRILFFSSIFPRPDDGTRGIYCFNLCRSLMSLGHRIRVISPRSWLEREMRPSGRHGLGHRLEGLDDLAVQYPTYYYTPRCFRGVYDRFMWASSRRAISQVVAEFHPDVVLSYWAHPDGAVAVRAARAARVPAVINVGGSDVLVLAQHEGPRRRAIVSALQTCDAVVTVSRHLRRAVCDLGVDPDKVHVVYQGVDANVFSPGDRTEARGRLGVGLDDKALISVGNLVPVKGHDILLEAMAILCRRRADLRLYLIGDGGSRSALAAQASRLGLDRVVRFVGSIEQRQLPDWYRAADITVLASRSEGIPNVLRESTACGTRYVATRVGGVAEVTTDPRNRLVPPEDPAALADAIDSSLARPHESIRHPAATWEDAAGHVLDVLRPLVSVRTSQRGPDLRERMGTCLSR